MHFQRRFVDRHRKHLRDLELLRSANEIGAATDPNGSSATTSFASRRNGTIRASGSRAQRRGRRATACSSVLARDERPRWERQQAYRRQRWR